MNGKGNVTPIHRWAFAAVVLLLICSCRTLAPGRGEGADLSPGHTDSSGSLQTHSGTLFGTPHRRIEKLIEGAHQVRGKESLVVRGKKFRIDCTGTIMAIYYYAGIDLSVCFQGYTGNGVARIYAYFRDHGLLYDPEVPAPGDIIFWDESYDKNGDGLANDQLTHMGMVVDVGPQGDITYVHHNYRKGIVFACMNRNDPDNVDKNSPMRMRSLGHTPDGRWLSSHLYRESGRGYLLTPSSIPIASSYSSSF